MIDDSIEDITPGTRSTFRTEDFLPMHGNPQEFLNVILTYATTYRRLTLAFHTLMVAAGCMALYFSTRDMEDQRIRIEFATECERVTSQLSETLDVHHEVVESIASFHAGDPTFSRDGFQSFVQRAVNGHPGIHALEWVPRVSAKDRRQWEQAAQSNGVPDFQFRKWIADQEWAVGEEHWTDTYYPVYYVQPSADNHATLGIDLGSNPLRRKALELAAATGVTVAITGGRLAQKNAEQSGFLLLVPIYDRTQSLRTSEQRITHLAGFALGVFDIGKIIDEAVTLTDSKQFQFRVTEPNGQTLYASKQMNEPDSPNSHAADCHHTSTCQIGAQEWRIDFTSQGEWMQTRRSSLGLPIFFGGTVFAILLGSLLWRFTGRTARVEQLVSQRTVELEAANELIREQRDRLESGKLILEESNQQLKEFAFAASHDLQTPLRGMASYAQFLKEDYSSLLDEVGNQFVDRIISNADRMKQLISQLLEYSQVESQKDALRPTDLNQVLGDVLLLLQTEIETADATITFDEMPTVDCDPKQIAQLFRNLMTNGLKYRSENPLKIHVSVRKTDVYEIVVEDNGIGVAEPFQAKIFDIFRRLHTQDEYPGTGIGLALCRRITQRHGGTISVDSEIGNGCRFRFTLPVERSLKDHTTFQSGLPSPLALQSA